MESLSPDQCVGECDPYFHCLICLEMVKPKKKECSECRALFCEDCITQNNSDQLLNCPYCRSEFVPSKNMHRFVINTLNALVFKCNHCPQTFKYSEHLEHMKECIKFKCPLCSMKGNEALLREHWLSKCIEIKLTCNLCGETKTRKENKQHDCAQKLKKMLDDANAYNEELENDLVQAENKIEELQEQ